MAGFMAGFGPAFSNAFNRTQQQLHEKKQDALRREYAKFSDIQADYKAKDAAWASSLKQAEALVASTGLDVPREAIPKVAEYIMNGSSDAIIKDILVQNSFEIEEPEQIEEPATGSAAGGMDEQMQDSGLAPEQPQQTESINPEQVNPEFAAPEMPEEPTIGNEALGAIQSVFPNAGKTYEEEAQAQIQQESGMTPEQYEQVNAGWQQPDTSNIIVTPRQLDGVAMAQTDLDPTKVQANIEGLGRQGIIAINGDGSVVLTDGTTVPKSQVTKINAANVFSAEDDIIQQIGTRGNDINLDGSRTQTLIGQMDKLDQMVEADPSVITSVAQFAGNIENIITEIGVAGDMASNLTNEGAAALEKELENRVAQTMTDTFGATPENAQLFAAQAWSVIFQLARANNGSGQLSGRDVDQAVKQIFASSDEGVFRENLRQLASTQRDRWNDLATTFVESDVQLQHAIEQYDAAYIQDLFGPLESRLDPETVEWLDTPVTDTEDEEGGLEPPPEETLSSIGFTTEEFNALSPADQQELMDILNGSN